MASPGIQRIGAEQCLALRQRVLSPDQPLDAVRLGDDCVGLHYGACLDGALIGVGSVFPDGTQARLRKLAIAPEMQRRGIGRALVAQMAHDLAARGIARLWCDARKDALPFYQKLGFVPEGAVFFKRGLPYRVAALMLT